MAHNLIKQALSALAVLAASSSFTAHAAPVEQAPVLYADGGRYYRVVLDNTFTWEQAQAYANNSTFGGIQGHLATINSPGEDNFVFGLAQPWGELWIGGNQVACTPTPSAKCGWAWRNVSGQDVGEPIAGDNTTAPFSASNPYTNWQLGEPNDAGGVDEKHLAIGKGGNPGWNDEGYQTFIRGFVIEYGDQLAPFPATECADSDGCNLTGGGVNGSVIKLPSTAQSVTGDYEVRTWLVPVNPTRCVAGQDAPPLPVDLVGLNGEGGPDGVEDFIVPGYLCTHPGNPQFLALKTDSAVQIPSGVVSITNDTSKLLDPSYICNAPLAGNPALQQDVVVFQYDDKDDMLETGFVSPVDAAFDGTLIESTNGCGTSRGSGGKGSWILVGLSIHQGAAPTAKARLVDLIEHKLDLLQVAVNAAKDDGAIKGGDYSKLSSAAAAAINHIQRGNFSEALVHVQKFQVATKAAKFTTKPTNWNGEFLMRADNIAFTLKVKVMLLSP